MPANVPPFLPFLFILAVLVGILVLKEWNAVRKLDKIPTIQQENNNHVAERSVLEISSENENEAKVASTVSVATDSSATSTLPPGDSTAAVNAIEEEVTSKEGRKAPEETAVTASSLPKIRGQSPVDTTPTTGATSSKVDITQLPDVIHTKDGNRVTDPSKLNIKINYPVFVASLYKSGTTTIHAYFECGGQKSVHFANGRKRTSSCLMRRITKGSHPVFAGCGGDTFDIYSDNANLFPPTSCFDPSVHGLDAIYESYPNGTILMAVRDRQAWFDSVYRYRFPKWALLEHLKRCLDLWPTQQQDIGNRTLTDDDILSFYDWHTEHVRNFAKTHPSMTYIEVALEGNETGQILEDAIGIPSQCWGHANMNTRIKPTT